METDKYSFKTDAERLEYLKAQVAVLPEQPGSYQYYDRTGRIIYVGKAKNLKKRVGQYFLKRQQSAKTVALVAKICHIHHIVVNTEEDALLLENNLIKKHKPQYNILLKDDKTYPWIAVLNEPFPRVVLTRRHVRDGSVYYGPYPNLTQVYDLLDIIRQLYPLRQCNLALQPERVRRGTYKVCLKHHLKLCDGPCEGLIGEEDYAKYIDGVRALLKGGVTPILRALKAEMEAAAEALEFERAQELKRKWERLSAYKSKSLVSSNSLMNVDVFSVVRSDAGAAGAGALNDADAANGGSPNAGTTEKREAYVNFMRVEQGQILSSYTMTFRLKMDEADDEVLSFGLQSVRETSGRLQREVVAPVVPDTEFAGVSVTVPQSGDKRRLLELSEKNARLYKLELLKQEANRSRATHEEKLLLQIKELLGLPALPRHMECFDNSNTQGTNAVAACVVYRNCRPARQDYRLFNIKTVEGPDDYASMYEVVYRRYRRLMEEGSALPDVVVADGGQGQMEVIRQATTDLGLTMNIIGLAKDSHHRTNQILVGFPPKVVGIGKNDAVFRFFTRMQDEVHRVAITFHRNKRSKSMVASELDQIAGVGPKTKEQLFHTFGGVESIRQATLEQLTDCVGKAKGRVVYDYFKARDANNV